MEYTIETRESKTFLTVLMDKQEQLDEFDFGMIKNNSIYGILPIVYVEVDGNRKLKYNITSKKSLGRILSSEIGRQSFLTILKNMQKSFLEQKEYMMQPEYLLLDYEHIFVDPVKNEIFFICIPIISNVVENKPGELFKKLIFDATYKMNEDNRYVAELINYLSDEKEFSIERFGRVLDNLLSATDLSSKNRGEYVPQKETRVTEHKEIEKVEREGRKIIEKPERKQEKELPMGFRIPEREVSKSVMPRKSHEKSDTPKKSFLFFGKKERDNNSAVNEQKVHSGMESVRSNEHSEQVIKGYEINGDGKLISCDGRKGKDAYPFLTRMDNNEKISISREVFRIGRGNAYTDYRIDGNPRVGRNHADIIKKEQDYYLIDNNSKNHTYINEKLISSEKPTRLKHGDTIRLADEVFIFNRY